HTARLQCIDDCVSSNGYTGENVNAASFPTLGTVQCGKQREITCVFQSLPKVVERRSGVMDTISDPETYAPVGLWQGLLAENQELSLCLYFSREIGHLSAHIQVGHNVGVSSFQVVLCPDDFGGDGSQVIGNLHRR